MKCAVWNLVPRWETVRKSARFLKRSDLGNPVLRNALLGSDGNGEPLSPLGATALDDQSAIFGGHPHKEAVGSFSRRIARLERSFHDSALLTYTDRELNY